VRKEEEEEGDRILKINIESNKILEKRIQI